MLLHHRQIEADASKVRMRLRERHGDRALRRTDVGEALIVGPRKFHRDCVRRTKADATHRLEKLGKDCRVAVDLVKQVAAGLCFVLRIAGA